MRTGKIKTLYWVFTSLLALLVLLDGIGGVTRQAAGQEGMRHLGYPMYLLTIVGTAKLLAVVAIVQTRYKTIKEWAYAGIAFTFIGAFASRSFAGDSAMLRIFPLIMLAFMFVPYFLWKKMEQPVTA